VGFVTCPPDTVDLGDGVQVRIALQDQLATALTMELALRDPAGVGIPVFAAELPTGEHELPLDPAAGTWELVLRARDGFGNPGEATGPPFTVRSAAVDGRMPAADFAIHAPRPNPFNPTTTLEFELPAGGLVDLSVYNLRGERVRTLVAGRLAGGRHGAVFDGSGLASGLYVATLQAGSGRTATRISLVK